MSDAPTPLPAFRSRPALVVFFAVCVALLAADLALKSWSHATLADHETVTLIPSVLALRRVENHGAVFGIGQGMRWGFVAFTFVALGVVGYLFASSRARERGLHLALAAICAGALGNLYDRLFIGHVRDMLYMLPGVNLPFGWSWRPLGSNTTEAYPWVFNLADAYLLIGIGFILLRSFIVGDEKKPDPKPADA